MLSTTGYKKIPRALGIGIVAGLCALAGCDSKGGATADTTNVNTGGGGGGATTYTLGGTVSGLTGTGLTLQNNGGDNKSISADGAYTFPTALADAVTYSVTVSVQPSGQVCTVSNGSGTVASANVTNVNISCAAAIGSRTWGTAATVESTTNAVNSTYVPKAVYDKDNNIYVFWIQFDGTSDSLYWRRYNAATSTWNTADVLEPSNAAVTGNLQAGVDANGNVFVAFLGGSPSVAYTRRYVASTGLWDAIASHYVSATAVTGFDLGVSANGDAIILWTQNDNTADSVWARHFDATSGTWATTITGPSGLTDDYRIESSNGQALYPRIAMTADGNAVAVWAQNGTGIKYTMRANYYDRAQANWTKIATPDTFSDGLTDVSREVNLAMDANGNVMVIWQQAQSGTALYDLWANRYTQSTKTWGAAGKIESSANDVLSSSLAFDPTGNLIAVWEQDDGTGTGRNDVHSNRYTVSNGQWAGPNPLTNTTTSPYFAGSPYIALDSGGNAVVLFSYIDNAALTPISLWRTLYDVTNNTWSAPEAHESGANSTGKKRVIFNNGTQAFTLWLQSNGTNYDLWYNTLQ